MAPLAPALNGAGFSAPGSTDDAEQNFIGSGAVGFDRWDLLYPMAPKPLLVLASARDAFGTYSPNYIASGREEFAKLRRVYATLGAAGRLQWDETPTPHALSYYLRTRIYSWFEHWLHGKPLGAEVPEPAVAPEPDETLWVGKTGNVVRDFSSKTPHTLVLERLQPPKPLDRARLASMLALDAPLNRPMATLARVPSERCEISAIEVETTTGVYAPAWLFTPKISSGPVLLMLEPGGRAARWAEGGLCHNLAASGITVCAADVRGIGDLSPEVGRGNQHYTIPHAADDAYAWASLVLGKPLLGQRVVDIVALVRALGRTVVVAARGELTVPALMASAVEPLIERLYLVDGLASYRSLLEAEEYQHPAANFVFGIAAETDLAELGGRVSWGGRWDFESLSRL